MLQHAFFKVSAPGSLLVKLKPGLILHVDVVDEYRRISQFSSVQILLDVSQVQSHNSSF